MVKVNKNIKIFINYLLGPALFVWLAWSIYKQIMNQPDLPQSLSQIKTSLKSNRIIYLIVALLLMILNLGIEAYKWMIAVKQLQKISFVKAFKAVLSGLAFSVSTPNSLGDYVGRALYMNEGNRIKAVSLTVVANLSQLVVTVLMGTLALFFFKETLIQSAMLTPIFANAFLGAAFLILIVLLFFYFRLPWFVRIIDKLPRIKNFSWAIEAVEHLNATLLVRFLSLSVARFIVFSLQYFLLFKLYNVHISSFECWMGVSVMFLVMAAIPTIALFTDVGLKNELSIKLIGLFSTNHLGISLTSLSIWFINLVLPALVGSLLILSIKNIIKIKTKNENY